ncbi:hypothetical protein F5144DRAFT_588861 [Chaetomium tenue]|uniref:Uncharacterized protein n=1 Tax=Chaetomium tenue TaxID=1854479 RepID=A0ACB7PQ43_9PEZI|nr:hypothetical protein F5144DRAFT_588861 [Chaetomium globosum]
MSEVGREIQSRHRQQRHGHRTITEAAEPGMIALFSETGGSTWKRRAAILLDNHYQWVIFLVIMVVAIVGIWVGACVWRRRYIRKKDRVYALNSNLAHATESGRVVPNGGSSAGSVHVPGPGMFDPAPISSAGIYGEKSDKKKKWAFGERT